MSRNRMTAIAVVIGLVVATVAAYWPVFNCKYVNFDDQDYVYTNGHVLAGLSWSGWTYAWTTWDFANWHPLTWLSLEVDGSIWKGNPFGFHLTNLILHTGNVVLLFLLLKNMTASTLRSGCVAALFALHPLHVESVAWISERKDVLSTLFLLLTVSAYVHYAARPSWGRYWPVVALFAMGLLAKPMLVTLPILLLLLDAWPLNRIQWNDHEVAQARFPRQMPVFLLKEKIPLLALALGDGLVTVAAQKIARAALADLSFETRIANAIHSCFWYLQKTFVPTDLAALYPHPEQNLSVGIVILSGCVLAIVSAYVIWQGRSRPHLIVGWLWFLVSLLPILGLMQVGGQAYADRYVYIPHIGLFVMLVWECHTWLVTLKLPRLCACVAAFLVLAVCGILTRGQISYWNDGVALWTRVLKISPDCAYGHFSLADELYAAGDYTATIEHIASGLRSKRGSMSADAHFQLGLCHVHLGHPAEAETHFVDAITVQPTHIKALEELLKLLRTQGRDAEAQRIAARYDLAVARSASLHPDDAPTLLRLGLVRAKQGKIEEAITYFEKAIRVSPTAAAFNNLGQAQEQLKRTDEAKANYRRALELNPDLAAAHFNLGLCFEAENDFNAAKFHFQEVLRLKPDDVEAKQHLDRAVTQ